MKCSAIAWIARLRRDRFMLLIAFLAGLGTAHILVRTATYGIAVVLDSVFYLSMAMNFLAGEGLARFHGRPDSILAALVPPVAGGLLLGWHRSAGSGSVDQRHRLRPDHLRRRLLAALES